MKSSLRPEVFRRKIAFGPARPVPPSGASAEQRPGRPSPSPQPRCCVGARTSLGPQGRVRWPRSSARMQRRSAVAAASGALLAQLQQGHTRTGSQPNQQQNRSAPNYPNRLDRVLQVRRPESGPDPDRVSLGPTRPKMRKIDI